MLHREQACHGTRGGADLRVDVLDVVGDRLRRDEQDTGDVLVRQSSSGEPEHLHLALRQSRRPLPSTGDPVAGRGQHGANRLVVQPPRLHLRSHLRRGFLRWEGVAVRARLAHRLVGVRGRQDPRGARDRCAGQPSRVPGAVEALAHLDGDGPQRCQQWRLAEHPFGDVGMHANAFPFTGAERAGFVPDRVGDAETTEVVDETRTTKRRSCFRGTLRVSSRRPTGSSSKTISRLAATAVSS